MPELRIGEVTLDYEVKGEGDPVLLIAGCGQPAVAWHLSLVPALIAAGYRGGDLRQPRAWRRPPRPNLPTAWRR